MYIDTAGGWPPMYLSDESVPEAETDTAGFPTPNYDDSINKGDDIFTFFSKQLERVFTNSYHTTVLYCRSNCTRHHVLSQ